MRHGGRRKKIVRTPLNKRKQQEANCSTTSSLGNNEEKVVDKETTALDDSTQQQEETRQKKKDDDDDDVGGEMLAQQLERTMTVKRCENCTCMLGRLESPPPTQCDSCNCTLAEKQACKASRALKEKDPTAAADNEKEEEKEAKQEEGKDRLAVVSPVMSISSRGSSSSLKYNDAVAQFSGGAGDDLASSKSKSSSTLVLPKRKSEIAGRHPDCDACDACEDVCSIDDCSTCFNRRTVMDCRTCQTGKRVFTMCQVRRHASRDSCWLVANNIVYDATPYITKHPGGQESILRKGGQDCTKDFNYHPKAARKLWGRMAIGKLIKCSRDTCRRGRGRWILGEW